MEKTDPLPQGILLAAEESAGRKCWERRIRERVGEAQIHLRFPQWEGAEEANRLVEEAMARLYAYAYKKAGEDPSFRAVAQYRVRMEKTKLHLTLQGYVGPREGYAVREWATLCFQWEGNCPCVAVNFAENRRKRGKGKRSC
jgi:hypothetical protein